MLEPNPASAQEAADESASRTTDAARAGIDAARTAMNTGGDVGRKVFDAWANGMEATLKATFEAENAALEAGISVIQTTASTDQAALRAWVDAARQAQNAALDAFRANLQATHRVLDSSRR